MAKVTITDRDLGMKAAMQMMQRLRVEHPHVVVGITGKSGGRVHGGNEALTVVDIGAVHEFGAGNVPERSFLRATVDLHQKKYQKYITEGLRREVMQAAAQKQSPGQSRTLKRVGLMAEGDIKKRIADGINPPLHPLTIARKKSSKPLIDTGQLRASIASELRKGRTP